MIFRHSLSRSNWGVGAGRVYGQEHGIHIHNYYIGATDGGIVWPARPKYISHAVLCGAFADCFSGGALTLLKLLGLHR